MKTSNKYIALAALALLTLGFTACTQEEEFAPQIDSDAVRISATIANLATRVTYGDEGATDFVSDDEILVVNTHSAEAADSENRAVFAYDGTNWTATSGKLLWEEKTTNTFEAYYPATLDYTLPTDQSTPDKLAAADRMEARAEADFDTEVPFTFDHVMAKVTFRITVIGTEFTDTDKITALKVVTNDGIEVITYANGNSYTAIITPYWYTSADETFVKVYMNNDEEPLTVKVPADFVGEEDGGFLPGTHYTFTLKVGKNKLTLTPVGTDTDFPGGWNNDSEVDLK